VSFKIIFIQKYQFFVFEKHLNVFEFKARFDLDLKLGFKFNSAAKVFQKHFHFLFRSPTPIMAQFTFSPTTSCFLFSFLPSAH
jgi:hypothetical protein